MGWEYELFITTGLPVNEIVLVFDYWRDSLVMYSESIFLLVTNTWVKCRESTMFCWWIGFIPNIISLMLVTYEQIQNFLCENSQNICSDTQLKAYLIIYIYIYWKPMKTEWSSTDVHGIHNTFSMDHDSWLGSSLILTDHFAIRVFLYFIFLPKWVIRKAGCA